MQPKVRPPSPDALRTTRSAPLVLPEGITATGKRPLLYAEEHVSRRIRARRLNIGVTLEELAGSIGIAVPVVVRAESGTERLNGDFLCQLAQALRVSVSYFFDGAP